MVENARKQAYILIKAREANLRATEEAKRAQQAAYQAVLEVRRSGADAQAKALASLKQAEALAQKNAAIEASKKL